ncbi:telomerase-binding protein EST1A-like isoform X1 [Prorops nasuta]|uniref:telomerase-binding protein EST1A-like isoform X1 n=1 Tax=Prorops nasuta TaxID=863751 RepID=UPI0034CD4687
MANRDKGRRKWGGISQDNSTDPKLDKDRLMGLRGGGSRAPPQALYRPGSGPLRKSGRTTEDYDLENNLTEKPRPNSVQHRLKQPSIGRSQNCSLLSEIDDISDKLYDTQINYKNDSNSEDMQTSKNLHMGNDPRKKNKKPEQQLYVPKKVKEAMAEQDVSNRLRSGWEGERNREISIDRDSHSSSKQRNDNYRSRSSRQGSRDREGSSRNRDDQGKRYSGNRRNRHGNENEERWRSDSPVGSRNNGNRKDNLRELRQGSEPLNSVPSNVKEPSRTRDTRSVEPLSHAEKYQGKPPSGKRGMRDGFLQSSKLESLPPRLQRKHLLDNGITPPPSLEESWNGTTVTFQGASIYKYPPAIQHSQTMQNLPPSGPLPPQPSWSNTVPTRSRGRGRYRPEEDNLPSIVRPITPDQCSAPSSRSHTPSQECINRSYDRRGSNSTMYTSMESLSRADSIKPPSPSMCPTISINTSHRRRQVSPDNQRRGVSPPLTSHRTYHAQRVDSKSNERDYVRESSNTDQSLSTTQPKNEPFNSITNTLTDKAFDWSEEVELTEKLEAEHASRSSSALSLRESVNAPGNHTASETSKRSSKKRHRDRKGGGDRSTSRDKRVNSRERQNNQQNRENNNYNNQKSGGGGSRRNDRRSRNQRSRESSKDRNFRSSNRAFDNHHRHRPSDRLIEENWRTGRKMSICDSDEGRQTPKVSVQPAIPPLLNINTTRQPSPTGLKNAQPPGVLVLPDNSQSPPSNQPAPREQSTQQPRTLFDPNNPNKPIVITSPGSRAVSQRENDSTTQLPGAPIFPSRPTVSASHHNFQDPPLDGLPPVTDQFGNMKPPWYDPYSESFRSAKNPYLLFDIERADTELQWLLNSGRFTSNWERVIYIRQFLQETLKTLLETDIKFCQAENVEQHFWKILFYNMIERLREAMPKENAESREPYKKIMLNIIDEGTTYLEGLLTTLENTYDFKLDMFLVSLTPPKGLGILGLALVSAQKICLFLGDLARYKEQANETTNYGKSRQWYLKAQQINPKNGRPYNQLALLAYYARRKLDAVYYYMRSLMASNPLHSAKERLIVLLEENRKKYESTERKRKEEREWKERARMKEKEGANNISGGLRREIWIHPGGRRVRRTTTQATTSETRLAESDLEDLARLTSVEVNKRFVTSYLHVHGKLITKIGMETFQEASVQMLKEFRALLQHSPLPLPGTRLLQLLALNMFAIETTQLKDAQLEQGYRSEVQERALVVSLQMFNLILERGVSLLESQLDNGEHPRLIVGEDLQVLLPAIKIWCDWMLCHSSVWNPPPSCTDYRVGPSGDAWSRLATMVNLLEKLDYSKTSVIQAKDAEGREDDLELVKLPEDTNLAGFTPLMSNPQDPCYIEKTDDMELAQACLRINKILFFGQVFLCGLETPVLKLQKSETGVSEYVSVVEASSTSSPNSPPEQVSDKTSDSELLVESYSEDEDDSICTSKRLSFCNVPDDKKTPGDIKSLLERKEELERRQRKQDRHRQRVQAILQKSSISVEMEVKPRQLVPDTNCFIDYLPQLQTITKAVAGVQPVYTLMIPLVVLNELEGLAKGADSRDCPPMSRASLDPEHVAKVAESAKNGLIFARSRNPAIRCLTTRGTILTSSTFTVEENGDKDGLTKNDDRILATCLSLCRPSSKESASAEGQPRRLRRDVVLLTEDRNLRVKALARDVPVREVPDFMQWSGLG